MCEFKVGDLVAHKTSGNKYVVKRVSDYSVWFEGFSVSYTPDTFELVERKQEKPAPYQVKVAHTFAVGDKGKCRDGLPYEVVAIHGPTVTYSTRQLVVCIDGHFGRRELNGNFAFDQKKESSADLMPPTKTVWRVELTGVKNPRNSGLLDMTAARYYDTEENARKGIARGVNNYTSVKGPFPEEREA